MKTPTIRELLRENARLKKQLREQHSVELDRLARLESIKEVRVVSSAYDQIRADRTFAVDDLEYDLFAAGWKAALAAIESGGAKCPA